MDYTSHAGFMQHLKFR